MLKGDANSQGSLNHGSVRTTFQELHQTFGCCQCPTVLASKKMVRWTEG